MAASVPIASTRPGPDGGDERLPLSSRASLLVASLSSWPIRVLPRPVRLWLGDRVADLAFALAGTCRARAEANLRRVLGPDAGEDVVRRAAREAFRTSVHNMADLLRCQGTGAEALLREVRLVAGDWSMIDRPLADGRGVVLLTAHLGAFDCLGQVLAGRGYRLTAVVGPTLPRPIFDAAVALRRRLGMTVIEASPPAVRRLVAALRRGECVVFLADRDFFGNGTAVTFCGARTTLPSGAVRLARETGAAIVAGYLRRTATGYDLVLEEPFTVPRSADRRADVAAGMERVVASLTRAVTAAPGQWAVFQPVWPDGDTDAAAR